MPDDPDLRLSTWPECLAIPGHILRVPGDDSLGVEITTHAGQDLTWRTRLPTPLRHRPEMRNRYLAACVNNLAMVHGARSLRLAGSAPLSVAVEAEVLRRYGQVWQLARALSGPDSSGSTLPARSAYSCRDWAASAPHRPNVPALGINIGQTHIKAVTTAPDGAPMQRVLTSTQTAGKASGTAIGNRTLDVVRRLLATAPAAPVAIGLAIGGIVVDGRIQRNSGVTLNLSDPDTEVVTGLGTAIEQQFRRPVLTAQDARSKAYYMSACLGSRKSLVLDLGTSLGGAYIDDAGRVPSMLNQVGRVAYDLSDQAVSRTDGQGRGLLSHYVSATGLARLARDVGVELGKHQRLHSLMASADTSAHALVRSFRECLQEAIGLLGSYYEVELVAVTGGVLTGAFGAAVLDADPNVFCSPEPLYDAAIGVAWAAANETSKPQVSGSPNGETQGAE